MCCTPKIWIASNIKTMSAKRSENSMFEFMGEYRGLQGGRSGTRGHFRILLALTFSVLMLGCGQKGPLTPASNKSQSEPSEVSIPQEEEKKRSEKTEKSQSSVKAEFKSLMML